MLREPKHDDRIDGLAEQLQFAPTITPDLIFRTVPDAFTRLPRLKAGEPSCIGRLIEVAMRNDSENSSPTPVRAETGLCDLL